MTNIEDYNQKMNKTIDVFIKELGTLRTGRANSNMLDLIKVDKPMLGQVYLQPQS